MRRRQRTRADDMALTPPQQNLVTAWHALAADGARFDGAALAPWPASQTDPNVITVAHYAYLGLMAWGHCDDGHTCGDGAHVCAVSDRSRRTGWRLFLRPAHRQWRWCFQVGRLRQWHRQTFTSVSFSIAFLALMLVTRGGDHNALADARRAQADEEEKEKLAYRMHAQIIARLRRYTKAAGSGANPASGPPAA